MNTIHPLKLTFLLLFCTIGISHAQKQNNIWCFGNNAGLDFNSGTPVAFSGSNITTSEGCASIADASSGALLFYTDGLSIWNRNHTLMANGSGLPGNSSSTQSALIVKQPGSSHLYYVFITFSGLYYSVVDMNLNGGLGDVVLGQKNILLVNNSGEKICGTPHSNGTDIWIMTNEIATNGFNAFLLSSTGVNSTAVHSNAGLANSNNGLYGQMKFSCAGDKVAFGIADQSSGLNNTIFVGAFNNATGVVSAGYNLRNPTIFQTYGVELSADGRYLYGGINYELTQFDLNAGSPAAVQASATTVGTSSSYPFNGMQIGPDGKIYVAMAGNSYAAVINNPNVAGTACNFSINGVSLGGTTIGLDFPSMVNYQCAQPQAPPPLKVGRTHIDPICHDSCTGSITLDITDGAAPYNISWSNGGTAASIRGLCPGQYTVYVTDQSTGAFRDTINIANAPLLEIIASAPRTTACANDSIVLSATPGFSAYSWNGAGNDSVIKAGHTGSYYVTITDTLGCKAESNHLDIVVNPAPVATITTSDSIFCSLDSAQLCVSGSFNSYHWNVSPTTSCISVKQAGNYYVTVTDANNCTAESNHIPIAVYPVPSVSIVVNGDTLTSFGAVAYQWYYDSLPISGATGLIYIAPNPGNYSIEITDNNGCKALSNPVFVAVNAVSDLPADAINVYPNPLFSGAWQLTVTGELVGSQLQVFDVTGRLIFVNSIHEQRSEIELNAPSGVYLLRIISGSTIVGTKKLVKAN